MFVAPSKMHLPQKPVPEIANPETSGRGVVLIPVFNGYPFGDFVQSHVLQSALWARYSWLKNTDASDYGIPVYLYVEEGTAEGVNHAVYFDHGNMVEGVMYDEGKPFSFGIKQACPYVDTRFRDYEWVFIVDSDVFAISRDGSRIPFFRNFFEYSPSDVIGVCFQGDYPVTYRETVWQGGVESRLMPDVSKWDLLKRYARTQGVHLDENSLFRTTNVGIVSYPGSMIWSRPDVGEWLIEASRETLDVEVAFALYEYMGNPLYFIGNDNYVAIGSHCNEDYIELVQTLKDRPALIFHYAKSELHRLFWEGLIS